MLTAVEGKVERDSLGNDDDLHKRRVRPYLGGSARGGVMDARCRFLKGVQEIRVFANIRFYQGYSLLSYFL